MTTYQNSAANVGVVVVNPAGLNVTLTAQIEHFHCLIGSRPSELVVLLCDKYPSQISMTTYQGLDCTFKIDGTLVFQGWISECDKSLKYQKVWFTIQDRKSNFGINSSYVGAALLNTLDTSSPSIATWGLPTNLGTPDLPGYGADVTFNINGKPNKNLTSLGFVYLGYEHNTANAAYWTFGQALEYIWTNWILPLTGIAVPLVATKTPGNWTFGGMDKDMPETPLLGLPYADAITKILKQTRCQWFINASNVAIFFGTDTPVSSQTLTIANGTPPVTPITPDAWTVVEFDSQVNVENSIGQLDIIGGKQQREVLLKSTYTGSLYDANLTLVSSDFTQLDWFAISNNPGWIGLLPGFNPYELTWSNYNVERYITTYVPGLFIGGIPSEFIYRYNIKPTIYQDHLIGGNLQNDDQPYSMLPQLLVARNYLGQYVNPDADGALEGVSPLELLSYQYPDGASVNLDIGYILGRGFNNWLIWPYYTLEPPYYGAKLPNAFTVAFECSYRAWIAATTAISGLPNQPRRCVVRDEFVHMSRETTQTVMPVVVQVDAYGNWEVTEGIPLPPDATRNYALSGNILTGGSIKTQDFTINLPAGTIVDGMSELLEVQATVAPYVGIPQVTGTGAFPMWNQNLTLGMNITDPSNQFDLTGKEVITAISWNSIDQKMEFQFSNMLNQYIEIMAQQFIDRRAFRRLV